MNAPSTFILKNLYCLGIFPILTLQSYSILSFDFIELFFTGIDFESFLKNSTTEESKNWGKSLDQNSLLIFAIISTLVIMFIIGGVAYTFAKKRFIQYGRFKLIEGREKERRQIAKSLHDEVVGDIAVLYRKLMRNNLIEESKQLEKLKEIFRNISHQLSSVCFDDIPFRDQVINLISDYFDSTFTIEVIGLDAIDWKNVNQAIKRVIFLSLRELIHNVDKHAGAVKAHIEFSNDFKNINIKISDDGMGFMVENKIPGIGLKNVRERVEEIGGVFSVESEFKKGTKLHIQTPFL